MSKVCTGCGESHDYPWGYCLECTACLIDMSRDEVHRLNSQEVLDAQIEKMKKYEQRLARHE